MNQLFLSGFERNNRQSGFTLIEMAIVILIMGIVTTPAIVMYQNSQIQKKFTGTWDNIEFTSTQIANFIVPQSRYPCPADRTLPVTHPDFGREFDANCDPAAIGLAPNSCTPGGGVCMVEANGIDRDGDGNDDFVFIGAVPVKTLREINVADGFVDMISDDSSFDEWGRKLSYAVTATMTGSATFNQSWGVVDAVDENYQLAANINRDGHYALISHGPDGKGGYTRAGSRYRGCGVFIQDLNTTPKTIIASDARDNENCNDQDATFMQGITMYQGSGTGYFDDIVYFVKSRNSSPWQFISTSSGITENIRNTNADNVGVLTTSPSEKLEVAGTIKVDNNILATQICDESGTNCFNIDRFSGTGMACPSGQVARGIANNNLVCVTPTFSPIVATNCSPGFIRGIRTDGSVICTP